MIALDTNILVHAHRGDSPWHDRALATVSQLASQTWALPWPCVHEFLAIVTHPRIFDPPTPLPEATHTIAEWLASPGVTMLAEVEGYDAVLLDVLQSSRVTGPRIHDARVAALCLHHGVSELLTADRDFSRFGGLKTRNPLV